MKTTLKYNTIETFQRQPAWKTFIDTIVEDCKGLYDGWLTAVGESDTNSMSEYTDFDENNNNPKELGLYEFINGKYILTADETVKQGKTYYKKSFDNDFQPQYPLLDYVNTNTPTVLKENISLKGLLRTLSLYGCRIKDINTDSLLPHTYKAERALMDVETIYGYEVGNESNDYAVAAIVDGQSGQNVDGFLSSEPIIPITDDKVSQYGYMHNIYGYNQKHPVLYTSEIKEMKMYHLFDRKSDISQEDKDFLDAHSINCLYLCENDITRQTITETLAKTIDVNNATIGGEPISDLPELNVVSYKAVSNKNSGIILNEDMDTIHMWDYLKRCFEYKHLASRWVYLGGDETAYIINDKAENDLINNDVIFYNSGNLFHYDVFFALSKEDKVEKIGFDYYTMTTHADEPTTPDTLRYRIFFDTKYNKQWVVMNEAKNYFQTSLPYLKEQLFMDECALKAQPLFGKFIIDKISMTSNIYSTYNTGELNRIVFEMEWYERNLINTSYSVRNNLHGGLLNRPFMEDISYGNYYYKWEQYTTNGTYIKDVYTMLDFSSLEKQDTPNRDSLSYFFDGNGFSYFIDQTSADYTNNTQKTIDGLVYKNTFKQEYFETMYFNHFVTITPIDGEVDGNTIKSTKLYCDNLELVEFGNIIPYIVTYDRKGEKENPQSDEFDDIDCSIFSRILSYNKRTHLVTVDKPVYFRYLPAKPNSLQPKHAVVAYENASPFNKIKAMTIVAPDSVKDTVAELLDEYKDDYKYKLNLITETEYQESL